MLPFSVKVAFFVLSITGTLASAVVLIAFAQVTKVYWVPGSYGLANLILQLAFCLGMIWKMDPFQMPHWFCITQTVVIAFGSFLLTGVCTSFSTATALAVFRPSKVRDFSTLRWRNMYYLFMLVFPALASAAQITTILKLDAVHPTDDLHCDASNPIWVRFLGYAGVSLVLCVPSFVMSMAAAWRLFQTPRLFMSSRGRSGSSALPSVSFRSNFGTEPEMGMDVRKSVDALSSPQGAAHALIDRYRVESPTRDEKPRYHLPFNLSPTPDHGLSSKMTPLDSAGIISIVSATPGPLDETDPYSSRYVPGKATDGIHTDAEYETTSSMGWLATTDYPTRLSQLSVDSTLSKLDSDFPLDVSGTKNPAPEEPVRMQHSDPRRQSQPLSNRMSFKTTSPKPAPSFVPAIWRLLLFQVAFFLVECFAALSTIIDVAKRVEKPTPFGTQHVALILAAWGPFVVFCHLPAVKKGVLNWFGR